MDMWGERAWCQCGALDGQCPLLSCDHSCQDCELLSSGQISVWLYVAHLLLYIGLQTASLTVFNTKIKQTFNQIGQNNSLKLFNQTALNNTSHNKIYLPSTKATVQQVKTLGFKS